MTLRPSQPYCGHIEPTSPVKGHRVGKTGRNNNNNDNINNNNDNNNINKKEISKTANPSRHLLGTCIC